MDDASFIRYLAAKKTVDDRSLNAGVWRAMAEGIAPHPRLLEIGGGIGTMAERVAADGRISPSVYRMTDSQPSLIQEARRRLEGLSAFPLEFEAADMGSLIASPGEPHDLVIANALLDIVDYRAALPGLRGLARPGGMFLFSITFDGMTSWEPEIDQELDDRIVAAYHRTMDERLVDGRPFGDSRCGRHLFGALPAAGLRVAAAGASDWVVFPVDGRYCADEAFFLGCMLGFFEEALAGRPEVGPAELAGWLSRRRAQLAAAELTLVVHQLDVLAVRSGRMEGPRPRRAEAPWSGRVEAPWSGRVEAPWP